MHVLWSRIALLAASFLSTHVAYTSPTNLPSAEEKARFKATTSVGEKGFTISNAAFTLKYTVYFIHLIDLISLLSSAGFRIAHRLPSFLTVQVDISTIPPMILAGTLLMCIAATIRILSYRSLGPFFTFQLSIKKDHKLVTSGLYSIVRHPAYTGSYLHALGLVVGLLAPGSIYSELGLWKSKIGFAAGVYMLAMMTFGSVTVLMRVPREDLALRAEFKEEWDAWAKRTPYRLIPWIY